MGVSNPERLLWRRARALLACHVVLFLLRVVLIPLHKYKVSVCSVGYYTPIDLVREGWLNTSPEMAVVFRASTTLLSGVIVAGGLVGGGVAGGLLFIGKGTEFEKIAGDGVQNLAEMVKIIPDVKEGTVTEFCSVQNSIRIGASLVVCKSWLAIIVLKSSVTDPRITGVVLIIVAGFFYLFSKMIKHTTTMKLSRMPMRQKLGNHTV